MSLLMIIEIITFYRPFRQCIKARVSCDAFDKAQPFIINQGNFHTYIQDPTFKSFRRYGPTETRIKRIVGYPTAAVSLLTTSNINFHLEYILRIQSHPVSTRVNANG